MADQIENLSLFQPTNYRLSIDRVNYRHAEMFCKAVFHPGATVNAAEAPFKRIQSVPQPGDTLTFGELSVTIFLDEDFNSYKEIYNWLLRHVNMNHTTQYEATGGEIPSISDITITAMTNQNNPNQSIKYTDAFPVSLGEINFEADGPMEITFPVTFRYVYFEIM